MQDSFNQDVQGTRVLDPETPNSRLSFRGPALFFPRERGLHELIRDRSVQSPDKVALRYKEKSLTYRELEDRSNLLARFFLQQHIKKGDRIGVALERSLEVVVAFLAILKAGGAYLPLDVDFPRKRIEFMLEDSGATLLLTSRKWGGYFGGHAREVILEEAINPGDPGETMPEQSGSFEHELAYVMYTSGSTGRPKGVMIEHHNLVNILFCMLHVPGIGENDKVLALTTTAFDIAGVELLLPLMAGAEAYLVDKDTARDGRALIDVIKSEGISVVQGTPATWKMMLNAGWNIKLPILAICGGEAMSRQLGDKLLARCLAVYNMYGPTETTIYSTATQVFPGSGPITIGKPLMNTQVYILDEHLGIVPEGRAGEICIGGEGVARGYIHLDALSAEKFVDDPYAGMPGAKMYRTGDLGRWTDDGDISFLGREDQQIKIRGYRVEAGEIEHFLLNLTEVKEAAVLLKEVRPDDQQLVAYVVTGQKSITKAQVAAWKQTLRGSLPEYMVPGVFVLLDEMPLTMNGKVDKKALLAAPHTGNLEGNHRPPQTDTERLVAGVWCQVLNLDAVDTGDDFFELGGHSLIAVEMMVELEEKTGKRLPMAALFQAPTVEKLSKLLDAQERPVIKCLVPIKPSGTKPPLYIVHGIGLTVMVFHSLAKNMDPEQPVYGIQAWGLNEDEEPLETIEEMAALYVTQILEHNPRGPYLLAGYSMGGIIVFEMARQLRIMGKDIRLLAMFDTYAGDTNPDDPWISRFLFKLRRQPAKILFITHAFLTRPKQAFNYQSMVLKDRLRSLIKPLGITTREKTIEEDGGFRTDIVELMMRAKDRYHLTPAREDRIELFRVKERPFFLYDSTYLGWKPYAPLGINITEALGDHKTFLQPPYDRLFAGRLQRLIDERVERK